MVDPVAEGGHRDVGQEGVHQVGAVEAVAQAGAEDGGVVDLHAVGDDVDLQGQADADLQHGQAEGFDPRVPQYEVVLVRLELDRADSTRPEAGDPEGPAGVGRGAPEQAAQVQGEGLEEVRLRARLEVGERRRGGGGRGKKQEGE